MVAFLVVGLYPHIPHKETLETIKQYLEKPENQPVVSESLYMPKTILKHNYFELGQDVYHQIFGSAIGTKFELYYVNNFIAKSDEETFSNIEFQPLIWLLYFTDIFSL